jgi:hypothetical protein
MLMVLISVFKLRYVSYFTVLILCFIQASCYDCNKQYMQFSSKCYNFWQSKIKQWCMLWVLLSCYYRNPGKKKYWSQPLNISSSWKQDYKVLAHYSHTTRKVIPIDMLALPYLCFMSSWTYWSSVINCVHCL